MAAKKTQTPDEVIVERCEAELLKLSAARQSLLERARIVTAERDEAYFRTEAARKVSSLSPAEREAMRAQLAAE